MLLDIGMHDFLAFAGYRSHQFIDFWLVFGLFLGVAKCAQHKCPQLLPGSKFWLSHGLA